MKKEKKLSIEEAVSAAKIQSVLYFMGFFFLGLAMYLYDSLNGYWKLFALLPFWIGYGSISVGGYMKGRITERLAK
jgi:hypothetical protein